MSLTILLGKPLLGIIRWYADGNKYMINHNSSLNFRLR